uniref:M20_dimer domain-containing protein n=1 Tax=Trichuris muris TaxID=70415 RepID=A0A5S6QXM0_TRIMR
MGNKEKSLAKIFKYLDNHEQTYVERLREAVAIQSVSAWVHKSSELLRIVEWTRDHLEKLGAQCQLINVDSKHPPDGSAFVCPPVLFGDLGTDARKKTVLVYGHLDVQPASKSDGWLTEPFDLIEKDDKLYGRGATDDKGPVVAWINIIEAFKKTDTELPVNLKFVFEAMEESGSEGLDELLYEKKDTWLANVDYVCICDNYWVGCKTPCITYGLRGLCYFLVEVICAKQDLHSGGYGGNVHEAMTDLIYLLDQLVDSKGKILIPGIYDQVAPLTEQERQHYSTIDFNVEEFRRSVGTSALLQKTKEDLLMHRWRYPSLSIHGIEGDFNEPGAKTVIPCKVTGKFSIRLVPNQEPSTVEQLVIKYLNNLHEARNSPNYLQVQPHHNGRPWLSDFNNKNFVAGREAVKRVYGCEPDLTREGGSIPITLVLQECTGKNVMLLAMGAGDDMAHSQNEKIDKRNYFLGTKVLGAYLFEIAEQ